MGERLDLDDLLRIVLHERVDLGNRDFVNSAQETGFEYAEKYLRIVEKRNFKRPAEGEVDEPAAS